MNGHVNGWSVLEFVILLKDNYSFMTERAFTSGLIVFMECYCSKMIRMEPM